MSGRCALYCRISREDEGPGMSESIANQRALLETYASEQGWQVAECYIDEDMSGMNRERPRWNAMLRDAQNGRFDIILCKTQSRFTRDMEMVERYIHGLLPRWGIRFVAVLDHVDTGQRGGKKARQINGLVNEWYLEDLSENIRAVLAHKRQQGEYLGSRPLYGYRKDPADRHRLLPDPDRADTVRWIFGRALAGRGRGTIARELNAQGVTSPGGGGHWTPTAVGRILRNEMYTGTLVQGRYRRVDYKSNRTAARPPEEWIRSPGRHEPLVDAETFRRVQEILDSRVKSDGRGDVHLLAGLVFCGSCGAGMVRVRNRSGAEGNVYLVCGRYRAVGASACTRHGIGLEDLTAAVRDAAETLLREAGCPMQPPRRDLPPSNGKKSPGEDEAFLDRMLASIYADKVRGILSDGEFDVLRRDLARRREALHAAEVPPPPCEDAAWQREWLLALVDRIQVEEADRISGTQQVEICWRV